MHLSTVISALTLSLSLTLTQATIINNVNDIPKVTFDFIIVGGGTAGGVVANRLTENNKFQVLVLEGGPTNQGVLTIDVPYFAPKVTPNTAWDYNYTTTPQIGLGNRSIAYPRGHVLGGSSSANYLMFTRGTSEDYDRFASVSGDSGWSWSNMLPYFKKLEKWTLPADNHNITGQYDPSVHGYNGILNVSLAGFPAPTDDRVLATIKELGQEFTYNVDMNSGSSLGMGFLQSSINVSHRSSSATAYLGSSFINRPNLHVLVNAEVSRVVSVPTSSSANLAFRTVEFRYGGAGSLIQLTASKEVILSAGTVGTPHILLNSGIGNNASLKAVGITPLVNLPGVGQNLSDHSLLPNAWLVNSTNTYETPNRDPTVFAQDLTLWQNNTGAFVTNVASHMGFMRVPPSTGLPVDPAAGPNSPHYELFTCNGLPLPNSPSTGNFFSVGAVVVSPTSRGSVTLKSSNPFDAPLIDPALLSTQSDKLVMRQALKSSLKFAAASPWTGYILAPWPPLVNVTTDAEMDAYVVANAATIFHPVGTSGMSPKGASWGVVDPDLLVKKVSGLRVVDASVMPYIPSAHTQGPTYAIAERASDLIKAAHP